MKNRLSSTWFQCTSPKNADKTGRPSEAGLHEVDGRPAFVWADEFCVAWFPLPDVVTS